MLMVQLNCCCSPLTVETIQQCLLLVAQPLEEYHFQQPLPQFLHRCPVQSCRWTMLPTKTVRFV
jgi:hypothetical protein